MAHARSFRSFADLVAGCMLAVAGACSTAFHQVHRIVVAARDFAIETARAVVEKFEQPALRLTARPVELVQACAHALSLAKRERPRFMPGWRMCPSI